MPKKLEVVFMKLRWDEYEDDDPTVLEEDTWEITLAKPVVKDALAIMESEGFVQTSSDKFSPGVWYTVYQEQDYVDGGYPEYSFHPQGLTSKEEERLFRLVKQRERR